MENFDIQKIPKVIDYINGIDDLEKLLTIVKEASLFDVSHTEEQRVVQIISSDNFYGSLIFP